MGEIFHPGSEEIYCTSIYLIRARQIANNMPIRGFAIQFPKILLRCPYTQLLSLHKLKQKTYP